MKRALFACALALGLGACGAEPAASSPGARIHALAPADLPSFFDCLRENGAAVVSAHRGGRAPGFAENTVHMFEHTLSLAPVFIEADVRATRDGALFLMHDETVDRTTNGGGRLSEMTRAEVRALAVEDAAGRSLDFAPTELSLALAWARGKTILELDIKPGVRYEDVVAEVRAADAMGRVVFIVNSVGAAARLARLAPEAMLYVTVRSARDLDELERRGVDLAHVVAWTGDEAPNGALNGALAERGVEARFGLFGGDAPASRAAAFAETGLHIFSTDAPAEVFASLDRSDGDADGYAALGCVARQSPTARRDRRIAEE